MRLSFTCIIIILSHVINHCIACLVSSIFLTSNGFIPSFLTPKFPIVQKDSAHPILITHPPSNLVIQEVNPIL